MRTALATISLAILLATAARAADVPALIDGDATWTAADSPYRVKQDTTVAQNTTLVVENGVTVELAEGVSLIVKGEMQARGTPGQPVLFTGMDDGGGKGRWVSVVFEDSSADAVFVDVDEYQSGSILEWCTFERGTRAVKLKGASPYVHRCTFTDNQSEATVIPAGGAGILVTGGAAPRIRSCTFYKNEALPAAYGGGIYAEASAPIIQDCTFDGNKAVYGAGLTTDRVASPIVGNKFVNNEATITKGGGASLITTVSAFLNNVVTENLAKLDGGGVHVCVDCHPHAVPFVMDNTIADNISDDPDPAHGAAGIGAAYLRVMTSNNIHGNLRKGEPSDFGWFHPLEESFPDWVANRSVAGNWWGTADTAKVEKTVADGNDFEDLGKVEFEPVLEGPAEEALPRVTVTTRRLVFDEPGEEMPVFLTLYNPGEELEVELTLLFQYGERTPVPYQGPLDFPGQEIERGLYTFNLPENSVFFDILATPPFVPEELAEDHGYWHAAIFDAASGERIGEACSVRFDFAREDTP